MEETAQQLTTADAIRLVTSKFKAAQTKIPNLVTLTPEQRSARRKDRIGARKIDRLKDQTARATANEALLPANFDLQKLQNDVAAIVAFFDLRSVLVQIEQAVSDTLLVLSGETVPNANAAAAHIKVATTSGQPGQPAGHVRKPRRVPGGTVQIPSPSSAESVTPTAGLPQAPVVAGETEQAA